MRLELSWKDPRLEFHNLNSDENRNSLTLDEKQKIWMPSLIFSNTIDKFHARFDEDRSVATVSMFDGENFMSVIEP